MESKLMTTKSRIYDTGYNRKMMEDVKYIPQRNQILLNLQEWLLYDQL